MDASSIVSGHDARPTLGKVSVGPLGSTHEEMLDAILRKQRRANPLKVVHDAIAEFFGCLLKCCDTIIPTKVSPEVGADDRNTVRPMRSETLAVFTCMGECFSPFPSDLLIFPNTCSPTNPPPVSSNPGTILIIAVLFLWQVAWTADTSSNWEIGATCVGECAISQRF